MLQLAPPTNAAIGPSPAQRRAATSKKPTLPSDVISHRTGKSTEIVTRKDTIAETTVLRSYRTAPMPAKQYCVGLHARDSPARRAAKTVGE